MIDEHSLMIPASPLEYFFMIYFRSALCMLFFLLVLSACTQTGAPVKSQSLIDSMEASSGDFIAWSDSGEGNYIPEKSEKVKTGHGQQIGDIFVDWSETLYQDEEGAELMGSNGNTFVTKSGNDSYRITILDLSASLSGAGENQRTSFTNGYLRSYQKNLNRIRIPFEETSYNGYDALQYTLSEPERSAKSLMFIYGNNCYTLQVAADSDVSQKFSRFAEAVNF